MRQETASWITIGGLSVLTVVVVSVGSQVMGLDATITALARSHIKHQIMQTLEEDVTRPDGRVVHVTTTRGENEDLDAFIARHDATVAALKAK